MTNDKILALALLRKRGSLMFRVRSQANIQERQGFQRVQCRQHVLFNTSSATDLEEPRD